eukprot:TRINITY_DN9727_c0_g1_i1.p1 TRINITY_DN9727_c0_g1~~TRINITY_DN9727_c0_g1_i1.p1  ORF type:complete len:527 (-),score=104.96 TRINITY_DN9727_c0_g1_i1:19-1599(-)
MIPQKNQDKGNEDQMDFLSFLRMVDPDELKLQQQEKDEELRAKTAQEHPSKKNSRLQRIKPLLLKKKSKIGLTVRRGQSDPKLDSHVHLFSDSQVSSDSEDYLYYVQSLVDYEGNTEKKELRFGKQVSIGVLNCNESNQTYYGRIISDDAGFETNLGWFPKDTVRKVDLSKDHTLGQSRSVYMLSFMDIMSNFELYSIFRQYLQHTYSEENLNFWIDAEKYKTASDSSVRASVLAKMVDLYLLPDAPKEINVTKSKKLAATKMLAAAPRVADTNFLTEMQNEVRTIMEGMIPRFLDSEFAKSLILPKKESDRKLKSGEVKEIADDSEINKLFTNGSFIWDNNCEEIEESLTKALDDDCSRDPQIQDEEPDEQLVWEDADSDFVESPRPDNTQVEESLKKAQGVTCAVLDELEKNVQNFRQFTRKCTEYKVLMPLARFISKHLSPSIGLVREKLKVKKPRKKRGWTGELEKEEDPFEKLKLATTQSLSTILSTLHGIRKKVVEVSDVALILAVAKDLNTTRCMIFNH